MNKKWIPYILIASLAVVLLVVNIIQRKKNNGDDKSPETNSINRNHGFDRRTDFLEYSKHAACRMDCRKISKEEVAQIMRSGKINYKKSDIKNARCPRYAIEGTTNDGQRVRFVFAQCDKKTILITVIDLATDWTCHCPGD